VRGLLIKKNYNNQINRSGHLKTVFVSGETICSSLDLIRKEFQVLDAQSISLPHEYLLHLKGTLIPELKTIAKVKMIFSIV